MIIGWVRKNNDKNIKNLLTFVCKNVNRILFNYLNLCLQMSLEKNSSKLELLSPQIRKAVSMLNKIKWYSEEEPYLENEESRVYGNADNKYRRRVWEQVLWWIYVSSNYLRLLGEESDLLLKLELFYDKYLSELKDRCVERADIYELNKIIEELVTYFEWKLASIKWGVSEDLVKNLRKINLVDIAKTLKDWESFSSSRFWFKDKTWSIIHNNNLILLFDNIESWNFRVVRRFDKIIVESFNHRLLSDLNYSSDYITRTYDTNGNYLFDWWEISNISFSEACIDFIEQQELNLAQMYPFKDLTVSDIISYLKDWESFSEKWKAGEELEWFSVTIEGKVYHNFFVQRCWKLLIFKVSEWFYIYNLDNVLVTKTFYKTKFMKETINIDNILNIDWTTMFLMSIADNHDKSDIHSQIALIIGPNWYIREIKDKVSAVLSTYYKHLYGHEFNNIYYTVEQFFTPWYIKRVLWDNGVLQLFLNGSRIQS